MASTSLALLSLDDGSPVTLLDVLPIVLLNSEADMFPLSSKLALRATSKALKECLGTCFTHIEIGPFNGFTGMLVEGLDALSRSPMLSSITKVTYQGEFWIVPPSFDARIFPNLESLSLTLIYFSPLCYRFLGQAMIAHGLKSLYITVLRDSISIFESLFASIPAHSSGAPRPLLEKVIIRTDWALDITEDFLDMLKKLPNLKYFHFGAEYARCQIQGVFKPTGAAINLEFDALNVLNFVGFASEEIEVLGVAKSRYYSPYEEMSRQSLLHKYPGAVLQEWKSID